MLRIISLNLNGIRSAFRKGAHDWLAAQKADFICVQEVKAQADDLDETMRAIDGAAGHFHFAQQKGYSGVGVYCRRQPDAVQIGFGSEEFDAEGRYVQVDLGALSVVSVYVPSGSSSPERQEAKFRFMQQFATHLQALRVRGREVVLCGDWNIAHKEIDLKNWRSNRKNSGFLPEERDWLTQLFDGHGFVDVFRTLDQNPERYTWWSNRGQAWAKNVGWRLDYQIATPTIAQSARRSHIYIEERFSDHAPLVIDYDGSLVAR